MTHRTQAIMADRFIAALSKHGISLKRAQLVEVLASAFGYHNSQEYVAATRRGSLNPKPVTPIGRASIAGHDLVLVKDAAADAVYALEESFLHNFPSERREAFGPSPYGGLNDLQTLSLADLPTLEATSEQQLRRDLEWAEARYESSCNIGPDWRAWEKDLKKASYRGKEPLSDEDLMRLRFVVADNICKSSEGERATVRYRENRFIERMLGALLARLDMAEDALSTLRNGDRLDPVQIGNGLAPASHSYRVTAIRNGDSWEELLAGSAEEVRRNAIQAAADHFRLDGDRNDLDDLEAEMDFFNVQPVESPYRTLTNLLSRLVAEKHPQRMVLAQAIEALEPPAPNVAAENGELVRCIKHLVACLRGFSSHENWTALDEEGVAEGLAILERHEAGK